MRFIKFLFPPAPSAPPTSVSTSDVTSSSITVQWGPVDCIDRNGDITGYSVRYGVQGNESTKTMSVTGGDTNETTITGLTPSTTFFIEVAAVNSAGTGVNSSAVTRLTLGTKLCMMCCVRLAVYTVPYYMYLTLTSNPCDPCVLNIIQCGAAHCNLYLTHCIPSSLQWQLQW